MRCTIASADWKVCTTPPLDSRVRGNDRSETVPRIRYRLDPENLKRFLDPSSVVARVERLVETEQLTENQRIALAQFLKEYRIREGGRNPADVLDDEEDRGQY